MEIISYILLSLYYSIQRYFLKILPNIVLVRLYCCIYLQVWILFLACQLPRGRSHVLFTDVLQVVLSPASLAQQTPMLPLPRTLFPYISTWLSPSKSRRCVNVTFPTKINIVFTDMLCFPKSPSTPLLKPQSPLPLLPFSWCSPTAWITF